MAGSLGRGLGGRGVLRRMEGGLFELLIFVEVDRRTNLDFTAFATGDSNDIRACQLHAGLLHELVKLGLVMARHKTDPPLPGTTRRFTVRRRPPILLDGSRVAKATAGLRGPLSDKSLSVYKLDSRLGVWLFLDYEVP